MIVLCILTLARSASSGRPSCACLGGPAYGRTCAPWDAADEAPWCHVNASDACEEETYEAEGGGYWSHVPCPDDGTGAPYDAAKTAAAKVLLAALLPTSTAAFAAPAGGGASPSPAASYQVGTAVDARYAGGADWSPAKVTALRLDGKVALLYDDGGEESGVDAVLVTQIITVSPPPRLRGKHVPVVHVHSVPPPHEVISMIPLHRGLGWHHPDAGFEAREDDTAKSLLLPLPSHVKLRQVRRPPRVQQRLCTHCVAPHHGAGAELAAPLILPRSEARRGRDDRHGHRGVTHVRVRIQPQDRVPRRA